MTLPSPLFGYYSWNWGTGSNGPSNANVGIAFTGYTDLQTALDGYDPATSWCCPELTNPKLITIGGGNQFGVITKSGLETLVTEESL